MTSDQRKTLEALIDRADHAGAWGSGSAFDAAAAIRAALAHVDALTQQVEVDRKQIAIRDQQIADGDALWMKASRENVALRATIADLEARAIPKAWVDNARTLTLEIEHHDFTGRRIQYFKPRGAELCSVTDVGDHHDPIDFPTLAAALSAAKEATRDE